MTVTFIDTTASYSDGGSERRQGVVDVYRVNAKTRRGATAGRHGGY